MEADAGLQPARIGCGWGESTIGVYRRETRDGRDVLGEVPGHPIDPSVGVIRVDDLDGSPIATVFRYSCHPVTMGPRSAVASSDYPGAARQVVERSLGGLALFLQGCGGNVNPRAGMGLEIDCRDTKNRVGMELGGEVVKVAAGIRTDRRAGERRPLGNIPNILFTPWERRRRRHVHPPRRRREHGRARLCRPALTRRVGGDSRGEAAHARAAASRRRARVGGARRGEAGGLGRAARRGDGARAPDMRPLSPGDPRQRHRHRGSERRAVLRDRPRDPCSLVRSPTRSPSDIRTGPSATSRAPRTIRLEAGTSTRAYAVPDLIFQVHPHPVALRPDSERRAVRGALDLIRQVTPATTA